MKYVKITSISILTILIVVCFSVFVFFRPLYNQATDYLFQKTADIGFGVNEVDLYGRQNTTIESISNIVSVENGDPIFAVDIDNIQKRLLKLAWVKKASVKRILPDKLEINIEEHQPLALWQKNSQYFMISSEGEILTVSVQNFQHLPIIIGNDVAKITPLLFAYIDDNFPEIKPRIKSAIREGNRRWSLILDDLQNGIEIKLPENASELALQNLYEIEQKSHLLNTNISSIDMRIHDKIMMKFEKSINIDKQDS